MAARRQAEIPGTERKKVQEVDDAAEAYVDKRDRRIAAGVKEKVAKNALIAAMKKAGLNVYRDTNVTPELVVTLSARDEVKVSEQSTGDDEGDDGEPDDKAA